MRSALHASALVAGGLCAASASVAVVGGCSGHSQAGGAARAADAEVTAPTGPGFVSPAHWDFHPSAPEQVVARVRLPDGTCVLAAERGQRWTVTPQRAAAGAPARSAPKRAGACVGRAAASSALAPEEIVDIVRRAQSSWIFVGVSGTLYEANEPLAPFTRTIPSPEPLAKVTGGGARLLAVTLEGKLLRWSDDGGWRDTEGAPGAARGAGTRPARVFDVTLADDGHALALAFPEALFSSEDGGATWAPATVLAPPKTVGAQRVGLVASGELAAEGLTESIVWAPRRTPPFARSSEHLAEPRVEPDLDPGRAATAAAVLAGRAVIDGDRYVEAIHPEQDGEEWLLGRGRIEGRLETRPIPDTQRCDAIKVGASGKQIALVCLPPIGGNAQLAQVRRSADGGATWSEQIAPRLEVASPDALGLSVAPDGSILLAGVCKSAADTGCKPSAPVIVRREAGRTTAVLAGAPDLSDAAISPAFSVDGRSAYFIGRRVKNGHLALFVSHDAGESFSARPLDPPGSGRAGHRGPGDDDEVDDDRIQPPDQPETSDEFEINDATAVRPGDDGTVGMALVRPRGAVYVTTDEDGRLLNVAYPPTDDAVIAGYGRRVLAAAPDTSHPVSDTETVVVSESLDGGSTWNEVQATTALARDFFRGSSTVVCGGGGCLFGETISRVGWGGPSEQPTPDAAATDAAARGDPAVRTPIVCEMNASSRWTRIEGSGRAVPGASEAMRGRSIWAVLTVDRPSGAVGTVSANLPESGDGDARVVTRSLFGKSRSARMAIDIAGQMEGYAAARVEVPVDAKGELKVGAPMKNVEIAWENWMDGTSGRATLPDAGTFEAGDVRVDPVRDTFDPALVSVSLRGVYIRPHGANARSAQTYFLDTGGKVDSFPYPSWPDKGLRGALGVRSDIAFAEGQHIAVGMVQSSGAAGPTQPTTVMLGRRRGDTWDITTTSLAPSPSDTRPLTTHMDWTYAGKALGMTMLVADTKRGRAWAYFQPFRGDGTFGPPLAVPTQLDLESRPRACSATERATTPRFEAVLMVSGSPLHVGTRHPVLVLDAPGAAKPASGAELGVLLTSAAVLHGTPAAPCVAAWEAASPARATTPISAIVSGDLVHSFAFRTVGGEASAGSRAEPPRPGSAARPRPAEPARPAAEPAVIEYRPMTCRFDPSAKIPDVVFTEPGTIRTER